MNIITRIITAPFRAIRWAWRRTTYDGLRKAALLSLIVFIATMVIGVVTLLDLQTQSRQRGLENQQTLAAVKEVLGRIDEQTNPEAVARQQQQIDQILLQVDCNTREAFQEAIQQLVDLGINEAGSITIVRTECLDRPEDDAGG